MEEYKNKNFSVFPASSHPPYILEQKLIHAIKSSDEKESIAVLNQINKLHRAELADSPLRSIKNSIIASCTLFTRAVIEMGVDSESAFSLSDRCIKKIENLDTVKKVEVFEYDILNAFIKLLSEKNYLKYSPVVNEAISIIMQNIQHKITLQNIAHKINIHPSYLSTVFKTEVGISISDFIRKQKSEAIRLFLLETSLSLTDIAFAFEFSSVAYFSGYFKKIFGVSPSAYRKIHAKEKH